MAYRGWRLCRRTLFWVPPAPPEIIKKMMKKRAATQHRFFLFLTSLRSTGQTKIHQKRNSKVDFLGVLVQRLFFGHSLWFSGGPDPRFTRACAVETQFFLFGLACKRTSFWCYLWVAFWKHLVPKTIKKTAQTNMYFPNVFFHTFAQ